MRINCQTILRATLGLLSICAIDLATARAGIMLDGVAEAAYVAYSNETQFNAMGRFDTGASGTLIAPNWVLTAGHLGVNSNGFRIRGTGTAYEVAQVIQHPQFVINNGNINLGYDLQLVQLKTNVENVTPATIYRGTAELRSEISITGYGAGGFGSTGATLGQSQRAGTNTLDRIESFVNGAENAILVSDFDSNSPGFNTFTNSSATPLPLEYHLAGGDSGGGVFMNEGGVWYLIGVNSGVESQYEFNNKVSGNRDLYGSGALSYMTRVSSFTSFIDFNISAVPEPGSMTLLGICCAGGLGIRAWRRLAKSA